MKTIFLKIGIIAALLIASIAFAQAQEKYHIGVLGSPQFSWVINQDDRNNNGFKNLATPNGAFGISTQYTFTNYTGIGLDVIYSMQGQRFELSGVERYKRVDYLKIPLMLTYNYDFANNMFLIGKIGPQLGINTLAQINDRDGNKIADQKSAYEDVEFGGVAMAGIGFGLTKALALDIMARFDYGFTDAENKDYRTNINDPRSERPLTNRANTYNSTAGLTFGLRYVINK